MRLEYDILWLDNDLKEYEADGSVQSVEDYLLEKGFKANITKVYDENNLANQLDKEYDFIISDFNLNNTTGDQVIYDLREKKKIATEIFFYSGRTNFMEDEKVKNTMAFMERISFYFGRDGLIDRIEESISLTLKKLLDINATRGLITAETSDLDVLIEEATIFVNRTLLEKTEEELTALIQEYVDDFLAKSAVNFLKRHKENGFDSSLKIMEAYRKWKLFRKSLKELNLKLKSENIKAFLEANKTYSDEVISVRNKFAHAKAELKDDKLVLKGQLEKNDFEYDEDSCIEIRQNLIAHRELFEKLQTELAAT